MPTPNAIRIELARLLTCGYPNPPSEDMLPLVGRLWVDDLEALSDEQLAAACRAYRQSPDKDDRWWPTPGRLLALSGHGAAIRHLGSDADGDRAWTDYNRRMRDTDGVGGPARGVPVRELDPDDHYRNEAMWAAHEAIGGWRVWARMDADDRRIPGVWRKAYLAIRSVQRFDSDAVAVTARMIAPASRPALKVVR